MPRSTAAIHSTARFARLALLFSALSTFAACGGDDGEQTPPTENPGGDNGGGDNGGGDNGGGDNGGGDNGGGDNGGGDNGGGDNGGGKENCPAGQWKLEEDGLDSCVAWTTCPAGTRIAVEGSSDADRECTPCEDGTYSDTENASVCESWTVCQPGTRVDSAGSATEDRVCSDCQAGSFSSSENQDTCSSHTTCEPGQQESQAATSSQDRICETCPSGTWDHDQNPATACQQWTACAAGNVATPGSATSNQTCTPCAAGTWDHDQNPATACQAWSVCSAGTFVNSSITPSATQDRACTPCASGTYSTESNAPSCTTYSSCTAGTFIETAGTSTSDQICETCPSGTYTSSSNRPFCLDWANCQPGTYVRTQPTNSSNRVCRACASGLYSDSVNQNACTPWSGPVCDPGENLVPGTASSDEYCEYYTQQFAVTRPSPVDANGDGLDDYTPGPIHMAMDTTGAIYVAGVLSTNHALARWEVLGSTYSRGFILRFDPHGQFEWARVFTPNDTHNASISGLIVDENDNVIVGGTVWGTIEILPSVAGNVPTLYGSRGSNWDVYVTSIDPGGKVRWIFQSGEAQSSDLGALSLNTDGSVSFAISLSSTSTVWIPGTRTIYTRDADTGAGLGVQYFDPTTPTYVRSVIRNASGQTYALVENPMTGTSYGSGMVRLIKYNPSGVEIWQKDISPPVNVNPYQVERTHLKIGPDGNIYTFISSYLNEGTKIFQDAVLASFTPDGNERFREVLTINTQHYTDRLYAGPMTFVNDEYLLISYRSQLIRQNPAQRACNAPGAPAIETYKLNGDLVKTSYPLGLNRCGTITGMAVGPANNLILAGQTTSPFPGYTQSVESEPYITNVSVFDMLD